MKTTIDIADALLDEARKVANRRGVTLRAVIEEGLRHVVKSGSRRAPFKLRDASFKGEGLDPAYVDADLARIRDAVYPGRGA